MKKDENLTDVKLKCRKPTTSIWRVQTHSGVVSRETSQHVQYCCFSSSYRKINNRLTTVKTRLVMIRNSCTRCEIATDRISSRSSSAGHFTRRDQTRRRHVCARVVQFLRFFSIVIDTDLFHGPIRNARFIHIYQTYKTEYPNRKRCFARFSNRFKLKRCSGQWRFRH